MPRSVCASLLFLVAVLAWAAGCGDDVSGTNEKKFHAEASFSSEVLLGDRFVFSLQGINGTVRIEGVPGATSVVIAGTRRVEALTQEEADSYLDSVRVRVDSSDTEVMARTYQPDDSDERTYLVDYTITIPRDLPVDIDNVNGDVIIDTLRAGVDLGTANGSIVIGLVEGDARMGIANGSIEARIVVPDGGSVLFQVVNGTIDLAIPAATSAEFEATVVNGTVSVTGLSLTGGHATTQSVTGTLGGGAGTVDLSIANGTIAVSGY